MKIENKKADVKWLIRLIIIIVFFLVILAALYFLIKFLTKW